ncbi:glycosyltransferase family 87 protein [Amycolatopsis sp. NPDC059657]|uniref:glycosyltransferase family 87 protein n=1 Tax=Amycolatopsis sp. NPDC059657 TaxID=3346899 RepID=UPI00366DCA21
MPDDQTTAPEAGVPLSLGLDERVAPSRTDPLVAAATRPIGGPLGDHAAVGRHWFWSPQRVGLLLALLALVVSWFGKSACIQSYTDSDGHAALDWRAGRPYVAMCYSDLVPLYTAEKLNQPGTFPYATSWNDDTGTQVKYMEYPVVTGLFQWINAKLTAGVLAVFPGSLPVAIYFNLSALWLSLFWLLAVWATGRSNRRRPWDAALVAISPLMLVHAFTNFDTIGAGLTAAGILAWARKKPVAAGVLLGLAAAAKLYPLLLLGPLFVLCLRAGKTRAWLVTATATAGTWLVVNAPFALFMRDGWQEFFRLSVLRPMDPDSIYNVIAYLTGWHGFDGVLAKGETPNVLNVVIVVVFMACCAGITYMTLTAPRRPRVGQLFFLVVAAFLLTGKVWNPQYSLWLVPLAVLAIPRWRPLLAWMVLDALVWAPRMFYYLGVDNKGLPESWFLGTVVVRDLALIGLCVLVVREIYRPATDLVRLHGDDDPAGGFLDGAPDKFVVLSRRREALA